MERNTSLVPVTANVRNGWLSGELTQQELLPGEPLCVLIERCFDPALEPFLVAQINGEFLSDWKEYIPDSDDHILVYVLPQGSRSNGKNGLMLVASIAVAAFAPGAINAMSTQLGNIGAAIVYSVGTSVVMSALSRALFRPPEQTTPDISAINPFYSLSGATNDFQPFGAVPNIYGSIRYTPAQVTPPTKLYLQDGVYLVVLLDFGYGYLELTNITVGKTDIRNHTNDFYVHQGFTKDTPLKWFSAVNRPQSADNALIDKVGVERTTQLATHSVAIELNFPGGLWSVDPQTGKQSSPNVQYLIECRVHGDAQWQPIWDFALPHTPDNADQPRPNSELLNFVPNWAPLVWTAARMNVWNNGLTGDAKVTYAGFRAGTTTMDISGSFFGASPARGRIIDPRFNFELHSEFSIIPGTTTPFAIVLDNPVLTDIVMYKWAGASPPIANTSDENVPWYGMIFNWGPTFPPFGNNYAFVTSGYWEGAIVGAVPRNPPPNVDTRQNFSMEWRFDFIYPNQYDIRIVNLGDTSPSTDPYLNNEMRWVSYTSFSGEVTDTFNPEVPHTVLEVKIRATDQTRETVDTISAVATRWLDLYSWKFDEWVFFPSRSPAWAYYDVLTGPANKEPVPPHLIDLDAIIEWDSECTEQTDADGDPLFFCDMIIKGESTVKDILTAIAATGRAVPCRRDMKHSIIRRQPVDATPVQLFTQKNTADLSTTIDYIDPPHAIKVSFMDETLDYALNEEIVYDNDYDPKLKGNQAKKATRFELLEMPGITRRKQAWRLGRYYFASILLERERLSLVCSMEHLLAQRGDLVYVTSDYLSAAGLPRRIVKIQGDHFWIDEPAQGITTIRFRGSTDLVAVTTVSDQEFIIQSGYQQYLIVGDVVEWGVTAEIKAPYIIDDIQPGADYSATVRLIEFRPEVEDALFGAIPDREVRPGAEDGFVISAVQNLKLLYPIEIDKSKTVWRKYYNRHLTWSPPATGLVDRYNIYKVVDQGRFWVGTTQNTYFNIDRLYLSDVQTTVEMRYSVEPVVDLRGIGPSVDVVGVIFPDVSPPANVAWLNLNVQTETIMLFWAQFTDLQKADLSHFEIRYSSYFTATWDEASKLIEAVPRDLTATSTPMRIGKYFIKAVDYSGNYSLIAATDETQVIDSSILQQHSMIDLAPFDDGIHNATQSVGGMLRLEDNYNSGQYYAPDSKAIHFPTVARVRLTASIVMESVIVDTMLSGGWFDPLSEAVPISGPSQQLIDLASAQIYFRYKSYNTPGVSYNTWEVLTVADVAATDIEFKVIMNSPDGAITASLSSATISVDWVSRTESSAAVSITQQKQFIYFQNEFAYSPALSVTLLNAQPGDWVEVSLAFPSYFFVTIFDKDGNWKPGIISWTAKGYGKLF